MKKFLITLCLVFSIKASALNTNLKILSLSDNVLGDPGLGFMLPVILQAPGLETIQLKNVGITDIGIQMAAPHLPNVSGLQNLDLSMNLFTDIGAIALGFYMPNINVNIGIEGANLEIPGVMAMFEGISLNPQMPEFGIPDIPLGFDFAVEFAEFLKLNPDLKIIDLRGVQVGDLGLNILAPVIAANIVLTHVHMPENFLTDVSMPAFFSAMSFNTTMEMLDLGLNDIGDVSMPAVASFLTMNTSLKDLNLSNNLRITDPGALALAGALKLNMSLEKLDLTGCPIGPIGVTALYEIMKMNPNIEILVDGMPMEMPTIPELPKLSLTMPHLEFPRFSMNLPSFSLGSISFPSFNMTLPEFSMFLGMLPPFKIGTFDFSGLQVPEFAIPTLADFLPDLNVETLMLDNMMLTDAVAAPLAAALRANTTVKRIFIRSNFLTDLSALAFADLLKVNNQIEELHMDRNMLTAMGAKALSTAFAKSNQDAIQTTEAS